jgi:hypothetical protein
MVWPHSQDYNEAVQDPASCFADDDLRGGRVMTNNLGLPMPCSGNFADVYEVRSPAGGRWAVKCFTRQVPGLRERYAAISAYLRQARLRFMVDFQYLEQGIHVGGQWYPALKMDWVEGLLLNQFVRQHLDRPAMLEALADLWARLARRLRRAGVAHGNLQHGNILLVQGRDEKHLAVKLIDYDGMFVPALSRAPSGEVGHPNYQHPLRIQHGIYNAEVDRFPLLVIYTAIRAVIAGGRPLWDRYDNGDNLLFRQQDLEAPSKSALFYELLKSDDPSVRALAEKLIDATRKPVDQTPLLDEFFSTGKDPPDGGDPNRWASPTEAEAPENTFAPPQSDMDRVHRHIRRRLGRRIIASLLVVVLLAGLVAVIVLIANNTPRDSAPGPVFARTDISVTKKSVPSEVATLNKLSLSRVGGFDWAGYHGLGIGTTTADDHARITVNGTHYRSALGMHPNPNNSNSQLKFRLRGLKAQVFRSSVAVDDSSGGGSSTALTFYVLGDGKTLWTSKQAQQPHTAQECSINVVGIEMLELQVNCPGPHNGAAAVWLDPSVTTALTKTELEEYLRTKPYPSDLRIVAVIDGTDHLRITPTEARWEHVSWTHPTDIKMNGIEWNPQNAPVMKQMGIAQLLGRPMEDLSKVRMKKIRGRGRAELYPGKDLVTVVFDDPEPGSDTYEVILTFD